MPWLASPAIESPDTTAIVSGSTSVSSTVSEAKARNTPLPATWSRKAGPPPSPPPEPLSFSATPISTGIPASTASRARLRQRPKIRRSSERRNRSHGPAPPVAPGRRAGPRPVPD